MNEIEIAKAIKQKIAELNNLLGDACAAGINVEFHDRTVSTINGTDNKIISVEVSKRL